MLHTELYVRQTERRNLNFQGSMFAVVSPLIARDFHIHYGKYYRIEDKIVRIYVDTHFDKIYIKEPKPVLYFNKRLWHIMGQCSIDVSIFQPMVVYEVVGISELVLSYKTGNNPNIPLECRPI
jgi:hypothetical protein